MANVNTPLLGYPVDLGNKHFEVFYHSGPASYKNIGTTGAANSGDIIKATDLGWGGFDRVSPGFSAYSFSGNYIVHVVTGNTTTTPTITKGKQTQVVLQWFTTSAAFGAISTEVTNTTNLSAETVLLEAFGV
jgi:hypothetical protein